MLSQIVYRFEAACQAETLPDFREFVPADGPHRVEVLFELVQIDLEYRRKRGLPVQVQKYLAPYPELAHNLKLLLALVLAEIACRRRQGEIVTLPEYEQRFPAIATDLATRWDSDTGEPTELGADSLAERPIPARTSAMPEQVGPYAVVEALGEGGMGSVYRVNDRLFRRSLAVKVLKETHKDDADLKRRFLEEAQLMGQLQHPGIPPVHDLGSLADGRPYLAMKLV